MKRRTCSLTLLILAGCSASPLIKNDMIDRWCGDHPCSWEAQGEVERVGSWHPDDYAVELVSDDAEISQLNASVDYRSTRCFNFTLIAKVGRGAHPTLELDFLDDGTSEFVQELPVSNWGRLTFTITAPDWYKGVRFIIRKNGPGEVILAELAASSADGTCSAPPVELDHRPPGARCTSDEECADGTCEDHVCGECAAGGDDCPDGSFCGRVIVPDGVEHACVTEASGEFGTACEDGRQCQSGHCQNHACSECEGTSCSDGSACAIARGAATTPPDGWPSLCAPGSRKRAAGELCTDDSDCSSLLCDGNKLICVQPCLSSPGSICLSCDMTQIQPGRCK